MDSDPIDHTPLKRRRLESNGPRSDDGYGDDLFNEDAIIEIESSQTRALSNSIIGLPGFETQPTQILDRKPRPPTQPHRSPILVPATSPSVIRSPTPQPRSSPAFVPAPRPLMAPPGTAFRPPVALGKSPDPAPSSDTFNETQALILDSDSDEELNRSRSDIRPTNLKMPGQSNDSFKAAVSQYSYNPGQMRVAGDSASAYAGIARGAARPVKQTGPSRAMPVRPQFKTIEDIADLQQQQKVKHIQRILPGHSVHDIYVMLHAKNFNVGDAMEGLVDDEDPEDTAVDLTLSDDELAFTSAKSNRTAISGPPKQTAKRDVTGTKNMMQKYSHLTYKSTTSQPSQASSNKSSNHPLRRLKKGFRTRSSSPAPAISDTVDISSTESEEEVEEFHSGSLQDRVLKWFNDCTLKELIEISSCAEQDANLLISKRPFRNLDTIRKVAHADLGATTKTGKRRAPPRPVGDRIVDVCLEIHEGLQAVDELVAKCEEYSSSIKTAMSKWGLSAENSTDGALDLSSLDRSNKSPTHDSGVGTPSSSINDDNQSKSDSNLSKRGFIGQPSIMSSTLVMKDYQIVGLNWLNLLWTKRLSCILADDMGLGKTCQVISFLSHLYEKGEKGPHLIVVPASTLENWLREFEKFSPQLHVEPYHGPKVERPGYAERILDQRSEINVVVTTYDMAAVPEDNKFMRRLDPVVAVYDEGHVLKNPSSKRYEQCMRIKAKFRLMLTGTPLQNNLQELITVLGFLKPEMFKEREEEIRPIFKAKARTNDADHAALLSAQRIARARSMITPFILRRKKADVLSTLPKKTCRVEYCELTPKQKEIYEEFSAQHQQHLADRAAGLSVGQAQNFLMRRRQAAVHPLLFRYFYFTDDKIKTMARLIPKKKPFKDWSQIKLEEALDWYSDFALHKLCIANNNIAALRRMVLKKNEWMDSGKVAKLAELLKGYVANGDRTLLFSQFTTVLDILESVLETLEISFCRIDGSTPIERRQELIDEFYKDPSIHVFMLSTRSGGTGINLACANKVVIFDSSFNPQDDIQAENRAHRVGQTREVEVIRLVTKGTIEEQIHALGQTKLALDDRVAGGETGAKDEERAYKEGEDLVEQMLLKTDDAAQTDGGDEDGNDKAIEGKVQAEDVKDLKDAFVDGMKARGVSIAT